MNEIAKRGKPEAAAELYGRRVIHMLSQRWAVAVVRELAKGPARPVELERRLPGIPHSILMDRLAQLVDHGAATSRRTGEPPPTDGVRVHYSLTRAGEELLVIVADAEQWERRWPAQ